MPQSSHNRAAESQVQRARTCSPAFQGMVTYRAFFSAGRQRRKGPHELPVRLRSGRWSRM